MNKALLGVGLIACVAAGLSVYEMSEESKVKALDQPREVTAALLLKNGPEENAYVLVSEFTCGKHLRFRAERDRVDHVLIEVIPANDAEGKRLMARTKTLLSEEQIAQVKNSSSLEGLVVTALGGLRASEYQAAKDHFPNLDRAVMVLDLDRRPIQTRFFRFFPWIYGLVGLGLLAIFLVRIVRPRPSPTGAAT